VVVADVMVIKPRRPPAIDSQRTGQVVQPHPTSDGRGLQEKPAAVSTQMSAAVEAGVPSTAGEDNAPVQPIDAAKAVAATAPQPLEDANHAVARVAPPAETNAVVADEAAEAEPKPGQEVVDASVPRYIAARPVRPLKVDYPDLEADAGVQGYVTIEFTLLADGSATKATVVDAKPTQLFNQVATEAVLHGRYDVGALNDRKPARARIRLAFKSN
jgi:TonB family protein